MTATACTSCRGCGEICVCGLARCDDAGGFHSWVTCPVCVKGCSPMRRWLRQERARDNAMFSRRDVPWRDFIPTSAHFNVMSAEVDRRQAVLWVGLLAKGLVP